MLPDRHGRFGRYGGRFVPETLMPALLELEEAYRRISREPEFRRELAWFAAEATDMRCGFDRLAERVRAVIGQDPQSGHLFLFRSRRGDQCLQYLLLVCHYVLRENQIFDSPIIIVRSG